MTRTRTSRSQKAPKKRTSRAPKAQETTKTEARTKETDIRVGKIVASAFSDAQRTTAAHTRASKQLILAFKQSPSDFLTHFIHALNRILVIFSRDLPVERLIQFVAHFSASSSETIPSFCTTIILYLVSHCNASTPAVRFRTVQIIASILIQLPADAELNEGTLGRLQQAIFNRADDRVPRIRAASAGVLCRVQETGDPTTDPCTALLVSMLSTDTSAAVRKAALQAIAVTNETIPHVLRRIRDVSADVRRCAYETLASKVDPRQLHQDEICVVLREGLRDRTKVVRNACRDTLLLNAWMKQTCNGNVFQFVEILGCHDQEAEVLNALRVIFESKDYSKLVDATEIDVNNLKRDSVLVLRGLCEAKRGDGGVDKYIRSLLEYSKVLAYYAIDEFASKHLLELCKCVDMSDEAGRKIVEHTIRRTFLCGKLISESVIPNAVRALRRTMLDEESYLRLLIETVRHDILTFDDEESCGVEDKNEENQAEKREPLEEEEHTWQRSRAINICLEALRTASRTARTSALGTLYHNLVEVCVLPKATSVDIDMEVKLKCIECIGLFCIQDKSCTEAVQYMPLFIQSGLSDEPAVQMLALKIIVDMLVLFDFPSEIRIGAPNDATSSMSGAFSNENREQTAGGAAEEISAMDNANDDQTERSEMDAPAPQNISVGKECLKVLTTTLLQADGQLRTVAAQGIARLLYVNRVVPDPELLACLMLVFHDPTTEDDVDLRQHLSVFFPAFAAKSGKNRIALEKAFAPMCNKILEQPSGSDESTISLTKAAQLVLDLTVPTGEDKSSADATNVGEPADEIHQRLAQFVLHEVINAHNRDEIEDSRDFAKILMAMNLVYTPNSDEHFHELYKLAKYALSETTNRQLKRTLTRFRDRVYDELNKSEEEAVDDEVEEESSETNEEEAIEKLLGEEDRNEAEDNDNSEAEQDAEDDGNE